MKKALRILALLVSACMILSMVSFAEPAGESGGEPAQEAGESPAGEGESGGDQGGPGGSGNEADMAMSQGQESGPVIFAVSEDGFVYESEIADFELKGEAGEKEADGIELTINEFTANGFQVTGGEYTIKNSTLIKNVTGPVDANAAGGYLAGVTNGRLTVINSSLINNGKGGRLGNYAIDCESTGVLVVINSDIIQRGTAGDPEGYTVDIADPPSNAALGISGYARSNMSFGKSQTYYYGSYVEAEGWAAMSTDSAQGGFAFYSYDSVGKTLHGGYGTYADTSCVDYFYATVLSSPEIGGIISNNGEIHMANGANASAEALAFLPEDYQVTENYTALNGGCLVEAGRNDFQLHSPDMMGSGAGSDYHAVLDLADTRIVTTKELDAEATLVDWYADYGPAMGEYIDFVKGANILVKSTGAYITLDGVTTESYSGVLLLTALNSDGMSRYAHADNDMTGKGVEMTVKNSEISGDVQHYDYQRNCVVALENTSWTGAYTVADKAFWDALWSDECKADASCVWILDEEKYFTGEGMISSLSLDASSSWTVTVPSALTDLTVEAGAVINGTVTVNGEEVDTAAGGTWTGTIVVAPAA
ncbi:MAG: hypothetical protein HUJ76_04000 [Parasporobacterium sp.]|nr:hypothetical protein [Parasporobacterium sp.]